MDTLVQVLTFKQFRNRIDGDFVSRLYFKYTVAILVVLGCLVCARQYVGQPIQCWITPEFSMAMEQYVENICWVNNNYWLPINMYEEYIKPEEKAQRQIAYYQWVPFILFAQAIMLAVPLWIWRNLSNVASGMNMNSIDEMCRECRGSDKNDRARLVDNLTLYMNSILADNMNLKTDVKGCTKYLRHLRMGGFAVAFAICKLAFIGDAVGQLVFTGYVVRANDTWFHGVQVVKDLMNGREWPESGAFPRVTFCDFTIRDLGPPRNFTVQCVLMVNMFNEKLFIFIWFWFLLLVTISLIDLIYWIVQFSIFRKRLKFLSHLLQLSLGKDGFDKKCQTSSYSEHHQNLRPALKVFAAQYLRLDGYLMLKLIYLNSGTALTAEITGCLWKQFAVEFDKYHKAKELEMMALNDHRPPAFGLQRPVVDRPVSNGYSSGDPLTQNEPIFPPYQARRSGLNGKSGAGTNEDPGQQMSFLRPDRTSHLNL